MQLELARFLFYFVAGLILGLADLGLDLADDLLALALGLEADIASNFPRRILDRAFDLFTGAVDTIVIHFPSPVVVAGTSRATFGSSERDNRQDTDNDHQRTQGRTPKAQTEQESLPTAPAE